MATDTETPAEAESAGAEAPASDHRRDAVRAASILGTGDAKGTLPPEAQQDALEWFLSDEEMPMNKTINVNIGTPDSPRLVAWTIKAIDGEQIKHARKMAEEGGSRASRRRQTGAVVEVDAQEANARIVVAGTEYPDLREVAQVKQQRAGFQERRPDPDAPAVEVLKWRLRHKPGLIDQLAGEILALSGYDDDDIQEHAAGKS